MAQGYPTIAGADEAGRGSLAGPLCAAAVILNAEHTPAGLRDSKTLTPKQRKVLYDKIIGSCVAWSIGCVEPAVIDKIGIQRANIIVIENAINGLTERPDCVIVDWYRNDGFDIPWHGIKGGDHLSASIAAASILAKVTRDRLMEGLAREYPGYGFERHKGYGSSQHMAALESMGPCLIHRLSFRPCCNIKQM